MKREPKRVLDSDVFIAAKNLYYAFDICPGFWDAVVEGHESDEVGSIDRVRAELLAAGKTDLIVQWLESTVPTKFFWDSTTASVNRAYAEVMPWVQRNPQFQDQAKAKFATEADGWLVAYSMVHGTVVVTNEQPRPEARNRVLLPDVCRQFTVPFESTFSMLRWLSVRFKLLE